MELKQDRLLGLLGPFSFLGRTLFVESQKTNSNRLNQNNNINRNLSHILKSRVGTGFGHPNSVIGSLILFPVSFFVAFVLSWLSLCGGKRWPLAVPTLHGPYSSASKERIFPNSSENNSRIVQGWLTDSFLKPESKISFNQVR